MFKTVFFFLNSLFPSNILVSVLVSNVKEFSQMSHYLLTVKNKALKPMRRL